MDFNSNLQNEENIILGKSSDDDIELMFMGESRLIIFLGNVYGILWYDVIRRCRYGVS